MARKIELGIKSARDIEQMLRRWANEGRITSKTLMGKDYRAINKRYASGDILVTSVEGVDVSDENTRGIFEELHSMRRVLTRREVMLYKGYKTEYQIKQAVNRGEIIKFDLLGRSSILFIE